MGAELVSIVIPVFNGAAVVSETLMSARRQNYAPLEIIVVDDGSTDESPAILEGHAREDVRVRIVRQPNAGVAAARNRGTAEARGSLIAFLDHDDLWRPTHIDGQVSRLARCAPAAVVYSWSCLIDLHGRILSPSDKPLFEGQVLGHLCRRNFIGNGSAAMIRKSALESVGGFDECLRGKMAGYDDSHLYLKLAERFDFVATGQVTVGYRLVPGSAVDSTESFLRSFRHATTPFKTRYPEYAPLIELQGKEIMQWCCTRALYSRRFRDAAALLVGLAKLDPAFAAYSTAFVMVRPFLMRMKRRRSRTPERFDALDAAPRLDELQKASGRVVGKSVAPSLAIPERGHHPGEPLPVGRCTEHSPRRDFASSDSGALSPGMDEHGSRTAAERHPAE